MLYLTEKDILDAASVDEMVDAIEASLLTYAKGQFLMPQRMHIDQGDNTMLLMPCFIEDYFATKLITLFPSNPEKGLPILNGIVVLNDAQTGLPVALLNAPVLTGLRTAAVAAVSIRHLAPVGCESVGIVGAGVQGFYQAWFASSISGAGHAYIYDVCSEKTVGLIEKLQSVIPQVELHQAARVEELLENSQVVITATTSCEPVLPDDEQLLRGKHFIGIGSYKPAVREFPRALFSLVKAVFTDTDHALEESGDLIIPLKEGWLKKEQIINLGRHLAEGSLADEEVRKQTTFFKSVGMALFDLCASKLIYEKAVARGLGLQVTP